jgi:hypothetical protein
MKRTVFAAVATALGLGEWFAITHGGPQPWSTADWLIATLVAGPAFALFLALVIVVPLAVIAQLKYRHR